MKRFIAFICIGMNLCLVNGCYFSRLIPRELKKNKAALCAPTSSYKDLISLPKPKGKIVAAVYNFRDQTGQYKMYQDNVSTFSSVVTQGATSMLIKALDESGWFIPVEREGLPDLINERKLIHSFSKDNLSSSSIPSLLCANILFEGGIIAYETNYFTGGIGARYLGIGASGQVRQDQVTIYLRAVSVIDGRILKSVSVTKSIFSKSLDLNVYKYVSFKKLLEAETGYSTNEPPQMCVLAAIEKAVTSLIIEGILDNLWSLENPLDSQCPLIQEYQKEKRDLA
ncbi:MAG: curli production assembly/transport protein CsgG [Candidatus Aureabacteria bacterium]|nr:curli production assembly/transport protein CsgG [Candidatus Auribacterota bacterium]